MREMVEESLSGTWAGMAQGDLAPEMMSSTKLSTVSRGSEEDMPQMMTLVSPGLCPSLQGLTPADSAVVLGEPLLAVLPEGSLAHRAFLSSNNKNTKKE